MIHVAPCSCELHVRIRELEAAGDALFEECKKQVLRAEKAEALWHTAEEIASEEQREHIKDHNALIKERDALQARVAELEKKMWLYVLYVDKNTGGDGLTDEEIRAIIDRPLPFKESLVEHGFIEKVKPAPAIEGQEREAD